MATKKTTTKKKTASKPSEETINPNIKVTKGDDGPVSTKEISNEHLVGQIISLNNKLASFFGAGPIWLTPTKYWCEIPEGLTKAEYQSIVDSVKLGVIVFGKEFIPPIDKDPRVLEEYWSVIKANKKGKKTMDLLRVLNDRGVDRGWTAQEIAYFCSEKERSNRGDKAVISILELLADSYQGPYSLYEEPDHDEQGLKTVEITSDAAGTHIKFSQDEEIENKSSANNTDSKKANEALDNLMS